MAQTLTTDMLDFRRASVLGLTAGFSSTWKTATKPSGNGIHELTHGVPNNVCVINPFGTDTDGQQFNLRVRGWTHFDGIYIARMLMQVACTLSALTGVGGAGVTDSELFVDTLAQQDGAPPLEIVSPATDGNDNLPAHVMFELHGAQILEFEASLTNAASGNCGWRTH